MPPASITDVSEQYLELVREDEPDRALIEMPDIGCVPVPVTDEAALRELTCGYNDWSRRHCAAVYTGIEPDALKVYERGGEWFALMYRTDTGWFLKPLEPLEDTERPDDEN